MCVIILADVKSISVNAYLVIVCCAFGFVVLSFPVLFCAPVLCPVFGFKMPFLFVSGTKQTRLETNMQVRPKLDLNI